MKKLMSLVLVLTIIMAGCGAKTSGTKALKFSWWGGDARNNATLEVIKLFESKNPGVTITPEYSDYSAYRQKLTTLIPSGKEADIVQLDNGWVELYGKDRFTDLKKVSKEIGLANWDEQSLDLTTTEGTITAVPTANNSWVFAFADKIWEKAGVAIPQTEAELLAAGPVFKEKLGPDFYPLGFYNSGALLEYALIQTSGKQTTDDTCAVLPTEAEFVKAYQFIAALDGAKVIPPTASSIDSLNDPDPLFAAGKIGGVYNWHSGLSASEGILPEGAKYKVVPSLQKMGEKSTGVVNKAAMSFGISAKSGNKELAAEFINFMYTDPEAVKILGVQRGTPSNRVAFEMLEAQKVLSGAPYEGTKLLSKMELAPLTKCGLTAVIFDGVKNNIQEMRFGTTTPETAAKKHMDIIKKGLEELKTLG
ncbi:MAG: ABC transporter substrate-binding protein [Culicoidibacterales bacterium]